ncbi:hypothetical protein AYI69_g79 [Smittium culicis]|uniref:Uncharacterized protein n=1 Tax=Smittium culicis TaxID=133412 RepID=A0A1R1YU30_9FUNG|nr:hypothetical protein AYI69_g79 [Smittium culicis]
MLLTPNILPASSLFATPPTPISPPFAQIPASLPLPPPIYWLALCLCARIIIPRSSLPLIGPLLPIFNILIIQVKLLAICVAKLNKSYN